MPELAARQHETESLLPRLEGEPCSYCDDGELALREFKGDPAAVCPECDVPQIRLF